MICETSAYEAILKTCPDTITLKPGGLVPNTTYGVAITNKFGQKVIRSAQSNGTAQITIDAEDYFPPGTFNAFAGSFIIEIYHADGQLVSFADYGEEANEYTAFIVEFNMLSDPDDYSGHGLITATGTGSDYEPPLNPPNQSQDSWIQANW